MLGWMLYTLVITLLITLAALAAERALRLRRAPSRWIWSLAMIASLLIPAIALSVASTKPTVLQPAASSGPTGLRRDAQALSPANWIGSSTARSVPVAELDAWLLRGWFAASATLLLVLAASGASLSWRSRRWPTRTVAGVAVKVTTDLGPAVVGLFRPRIVVPEWLSELPAAQQALVIAHEHVHLEARDPQALAVALCLLLCTPWNAPLWWQLRRLRRAAELDCDAGVLRTGVEAKEYGSTLLAVGQRQSTSLTTVAAMSEPQSFLEERITVMMCKPVSSWAVTAAAFSCLSVTLVAVATQVTAPSVRPVARASTAGGGVAAGAPVQVAPAVLDGYAGYYQYGEDAEFTTVKRDGNHLTVEFPGLAPIPMYPSTATVFFAEDTDAQVSFMPDASGEASAALLQQNGASTPMRRIDPATAEALRSALQAKVQSQTPDRASEAMLRRMINGIVAGNPNLKEMNPQLAAAIHKDLPKLQAKLATLGAVESIRFVGVSPSGMDLYEVRHAQGASQWSLVLDSKGTLVGAMVPL